jgi:hypothetical protein
MYTTEEMIEMLVSALPADAESRDVQVFRSALQRLVNVACVEQVQRIQEDLDTVYLAGKLWRR